MAHWPRGGRPHPHVRSRSSARPANRSARPAGWVRGAHGRAPAARRRAGSAHLRWQPLCALGLVLLALASFGVQSSVTGPTSGGAGSPPASTRASATAPAAVATATPGQVNAGAAWLDRDLEARLRAELPVELGRISVWTRNLATGATAAIDADSPHPAASLIKIPVLLDALGQVRAGRLALDDELTIESEHWEAGSGVLQAQVGTRQPVERLLWLMMGVSDNIAAAVLLDRIDREEVQRFVQHHGLTSTVIRPRAADLDPDWARVPNQTSARDIGTLLELLARGRLFDAATTDLALRLMRQPQPSDWLAPGLPPGIPLAHKTGELPGVRHDCGVVLAPVPYVLCVLTSDLRDQDEAARVIAGLSRVTYAHYTR